MAASVPPALKSAEITRFALRAAQVETVRPVIAYWCNYWIVNQIVSKGLHQTDDECMNYTAGLMDKLEQAKIDYADEIAITDDTAGQAYVGKFGLETFVRAENAMRANKATRQTADTFQAAATFLDLLRIWAPVLPELAQRSKFAKYHALRIAKALKAGEDPNLTNPTTEPPSGQEQPPIDHPEPGGQSTDSPAATSKQPDTFRQPSVEEVPDDHDQLQPKLANTSDLDRSLRPSQVSSHLQYPTEDSSHVSAGEPSPQDMSGEKFSHNTSNEDVSPLAPSNEDRRASGGGGYFPRPLGMDSGATNSTLTNAPPDFQGLPISPELPPPPPQEPRGDITPEFLDISQHLPSHPVQTPYHQPHIQHSHSTQPPSTPNTNPYAPVQPVVPYPVVQRITPQVPTQPIVVPGTFTTDEEAILKAQKHARWAISALNFEDVNTAVKELRGALESLGAV